MTDLTFEDWEKRVTPRKREPELNRQGMILYQSNGMCGEAGEVANNAKKIVRDGETAERVEAVLDECGDTLFYMKRLLAKFGCTVQDAAEALVQKLDKQGPPLEVWPAVRIVVGTWTKYDIWLRRRRPSLDPMTVIYISGSGDLKKLQGYCLPKALLDECLVDLTDGDPAMRETLAYCKSLFA